MKKKYYILVLTFLCMLCGQMSYGQDTFGGDAEEEPVDGGNSLNQLGDWGSYDAQPGEIDSWTNNQGHYFILQENSDGDLRIVESYQNEEGEAVFNVHNYLDDNFDPYDPDSYSFDDDTYPLEEEDECDSSNPYYLGDCECWGYDCGEQEPEPDCEDEKYEQAIRNGKIIFTKKYGWVDMTHAFLDTSRDSPIGVNNLWNQLKEPPSQSQIYMGYYSVNYKQDVVVAGVSIGIERQFLVRPGLTLEERKSVALAILQNVSTAFELLQSAHPTSTSSFEPADLPSNMLNFYRHVEGLTQQQILDAIEPVSIEQSIEVLRLYPCTFASDEYKNRSFDPFRFESPYTSQNFGVPDMLNTIEPFEVKSAIDFGNADLILLEQDIISN